MVNSTYCGGAASISIMSSTCEYGGALRSTIQPVSPLQEANLHTVGQRLQDQKL